MDNQTQNAKKRMKYHENRQLRESMQRERRMALEELAQRIQAVLASKQARMLEAQISAEMP
jgi:hypothetical protein